MRLKCEKQTHMPLQDGVAMSVAQVSGKPSHEQDKRNYALVAWEIPVLFY